MHDTPIPPELLDAHREATALFDALEADWRQVVRDYVTACTSASSPADRDATRTRLYQLAYLREAGRPMVINHYPPSDIATSTTSLAECLTRWHNNARHDTPLPFLSQIRDRDVT